MISTVLFATGFIALCFMGFGIGVLFFNKAANREACGSVPHVEKNEDCPSHRAGLCPVEDVSGTMKMAYKSRISYKKVDIN